MNHEWHRDKQEDGTNRYLLESRAGTFHIKGMMAGKEIVGWEITGKDAGADYSGERDHLTLKRAKAAIEDSIPDPYRESQKAIDRLDAEYKWLHPMRERIYERHLRVKAEPKHYRMAHNWLKDRLDTIETEITFLIGFALNGELRKDRDKYPNLAYKVSYEANPKAYYALWNREGGFLPAASANRGQEACITIDFLDRQTGKRAGYIRFRPENIHEGGTWSRRETNAIRLKKTTEAYQERTKHLSLRDIYRLIDIAKIKRGTCSARIEYLLKKSEATTPALEGLKNRMPDHMEMRTTGTTYGTRILIGRSGFSDYSDSYIQIGMDSDGKIVNITIEIKGGDLDPSVLDAILAHIQ